MAHTHDYTEAKPSCCKICSWRRDGYLALWKCAHPMTRKANGRRSRKILPKREGCPPFWCPLPPMEGWGGQLVMSEIEMLALCDMLMLADEHRRLRPQEFSVLQRLADREARRRGYRGGWLDAHHRGQLVAAKPEGET